MERISAEELRKTADGRASISELEELCFLAADTIEEMDKDIAIYEHELDQLRARLSREREESEERP